MITILNVEAYALSYEYIVARYVEGDWWFYGAWNDAETAYKIAMLEGGQVFKMKEVNPEIWG